MAMAEKKFGERTEKTQIYELTDTQKRMVELLRSDKQLSVQILLERYACSEIGGTFILI